MFIFLFFSSKLKDDTFICSFIHLLSTQWEQNSPKWVDHNWRSRRRDIVANVPDCRGSLLSNWSCFLSKVVLHFFWIFWFLWAVLFVFFWNMIHRSKLLKSTALIPECQAKSAWWTCFPKSMTYKVTCYKSWAKLPQKQDPNENLVTYMTWAIENAFH